MCPRGRRFLSGAGSLGGRARLVCHVLALELPGGLALIDTGFGTDDVRDVRRLGQPFRALTSPRPRLEETALHQLRALGHDPADVRDVILTHLDIDHAAGLADFPNARVHVLAREHEVAMSPPLRERQRYGGAARAHWAHHPDWVTHDPTGDRWMGFESVRVLPDAAVDVALVPLHGHTLGHAGVAVPRTGGGWLLHCGDAYFHRAELQTPPAGPSGLELFQRLIQADSGMRRRNQDRLRELARDHGSEVALVCSHDPVELERAQTGAL
jgi:glyoxylase-like metal-dependent hydrolase (beta-lactamase superfamily II)